MALDAPALDEIGVSDSYRRVAGLADHASFHLELLDRQLQPLARQLEQHGACFGSRSP